MIDNFEESVMYNINELISDSCGNISNVVYRSHE